MRELKDWNNQPITVKSKSPTNPCLAKFGAGEEGVTCRLCIHLRYDQGYRRKRHWCGELASWKDGKPEHMIGWQSCAKYEQREEPYYGG